MEGSQTPGDQGTPEAEGEGQPRTDAFGQPLAEGQAGEGTGEGTVEGAEPSAAPVPSASDEERLSDLPDEERNPAVDQAPAATAAQDVVVGDPGLRDEQQPVASVGSPDIPVRTSAPPPSAQSGVPLPEDRAAGVQPGVSGPAVAGGQEQDEDEAPDHDGS